VRTAAAIVCSVFDSAIRNINALEHRIAEADTAADSMLWEQAADVVEQLDAGLSQRQLAERWINIRTGEPYDEKHVRIVRKVWEKAAESTPQDRPSFRTLYNQIGNVSSKVNRLLHQTGEYEWYSPREVVDAARDVLGGIDLDPASCAVANTVVQAAHIYTVEDNGLRQPWRGRVWMNPPYKAPEIEQFCEKFAHHVAAADISAGVVLVNNCTDTQWFSTLATAAAAFCFPSARCRYWQPDRETSTALQGQAVIYTGPDRAAFCQRFADIGLVLVRP
jgi:hypothetical protein